MTTRAMTPRGSEFPSIFSCPHERHGRRIYDCLATTVAGALPMRPQLSVLAHVGHVIARLANGAQRAAVFGRQGPV
jgi:hypothetical protein